VTGVDTGKNRDPVGYSEFSDLYIGAYASQKVALKRLCTSRLNGVNINEVGDPGLMNHTATEVLQQLRREALIWRQLKHPNVLPFIGLDSETFVTKNEISIVSPWMARGNLMDYIHSDTYDAQLDRDRLVSVKSCFVRPPPLNRTF
jgi:serine/threonine protein kinase